MPLNASQSSHAATSQPSTPSTAVKLLMAAGMVLALGACGSQWRYSGRALLRPALRRVGGGRKSQRIRRDDMQGARRGIGIGEGGGHDILRLMMHEA